MPPYSHLQLSRPRSEEGIPLAGEELLTRGPEGWGESESSMYLCPDLGLNLGSTQCLCICVCY